MAKSTEPNDIQILAEKIHGIRTAMLTTTDDDGVLRSRPMATQELDAEGRLWFFTKDKTAKVNSIQHDQHVNVAYADHDSKRWVSIAGRARLVRDRKKMKEMWTPMLSVWFKDGVDDPELALICVDVESAQYWDSPSGPIIMLMGFAKQMLTGKALDPDQDAEKMDLRH